MTDESTQTPPPSREDPRHRSDFDRRLYPQINGQDGPAPGATERNDRIKLEFLAVYYGLNCECSSLLAVRAQPDTPQRKETELETLRAIERLLAARDRLEDKYAPLGVIVEPVTRDGFTVNMNISFGNVDAFGRLRSDYYTITAHVPVPLPEGVTFDDLDITIEGPGIHPQLGAPA
jgi:hypothetical protein